MKVIFEISREVNTTFEWYPLKIKARSPLKNKKKTVALKGQNSVGSIFIFPKTQFTKNITLFLAKFKFRNHRNLNNIFLECLQDSRSLQKKKGA